MAQFMTTTSELKELKVTVKLNNLILELELEQIEPINVDIAFYRDSAGECEIQSVTTITQLKLSSEMCSALVLDAGTDVSAMLDHDWYVDQEDQLAISFRDDT